MEAIIIIMDLFENVFIVVWVFVCCAFGIAAVVNISAIIILFFFVLFTSLFSSEAVYINSVIIPDENVMIKMNEIHLLVEILYIGMVDITDNTRMVMASEIGLIVFVLMYSVIIAIAVIFFFFL